MPCNWYLKTSQIRSELIRFTRFSIDLPSCVGGELGGRVLGVIREFFSEFVFLLCFPHSVAVLHYRHLTLRVGGDNGRFATDLVGYTLHVEDRAFLDIAGCFFARSIHLRDP